MNTEQKLRVFTWVLPVVSVLSGLALSFYVGQLHGEIQVLRTLVADDRAFYLARIRILHGDLATETEENARCRARCPDEHDLELGRIAREEADQEAYEERHNAWCARMQDAGVVP